VKLAFTLIEMLAVIALVSMIAAVSAVGLGASNEQARLRSTVAHWQNLDGEARLFARTSRGAVNMVVTEDRTQVLLKSLAGIELASIDLPGNLQGQILCDGQPVLRSGCVRFDAFGRSLDYRIQVESEGELVAGWSVAGLTGWIIEAEESE
jgi:prepilin-type N-terminal cleavage/methylation domain-containing protein